MTSMISAIIAEAISTTVVELNRLGKEGQVTLLSNSL